jgi:hypothetical protein
MKILFEQVKKALQFAGLVLFQVLIFFWAIKLFYCVRGYFAAGTNGMIAALMHGAPFPVDPADWGRPHWGFQVIRLVMIAFITVTLGILNRRTIARFWHELRHGSTKTH